MPQLLVPEARVGTLALTSYVALGDGYTAGFTNGDPEPNSLRGLYPEGQTAAYPALLAQQFQLLAPLAYEPHLVPGTGTGYRWLQAVSLPPCGPQEPRYLVQDTASTVNWERPPVAGADLRNLGVPHLRVGQVAADSFGRTSPFFKRLHSGYAGNYLDLLTARELPFFTLWLGTEDVLDYAMTGAAHPGYPATSVARFAAAYGALLDTLATQGRVQGVIGNVPDITRFPYFAAVEPQFISVENCQGSLRPVYITTGAGEVRAATAQDRILLPAKAEIGQANGRPGGLGLDPANPLPDLRVLDAEEVAAVRQLIQGYNGVLDSLIEVHNARRGAPWLARADVHAAFTLVAGGTTEDGLHLSAAYLTGGIFGLDGVYLTPRGNALIANTFIRAINQFEPFRARIPELQVTAYPGVAFP